MGKIWTYADLVRDKREERVEHLRRELSTDHITRDETIRMVETLEGKWQYYHSHYWRTVINAMIATLAMIALPYIIRKDTGTVPELVAVFPAIAVVVAFFCVVALKGEEARLNNIELKVQSLSQALSDAFVDFEPSQFSGIGVFSRLNTYRASNLVLYLFIVLGALAVLELFMILAGHFF